MIILAPSRCGTHAAQIGTSYYNRTTRAEANTKKGIVSS
jgi:hypothetical protein